MWFLKCNIVLILMLVQGYWAANYYAPSNTFSRFFNKNKNNRKHILGPVSDTICRWYKLGPSPTVNRYGAKNRVVTSVIPKRYKTCWWELYDRETTAVDYYEDQYSEVGPSNGMSYDYLYYYDQQRRHQAAKPVFWNTRDFISTYYGLQQYGGSSCRQCCCYNGGQAENMFWGYYL